MRPSRSNTRSTDHYTNAGSADRYADAGSTHGHTDTSSANCHADRHAYSCPSDQDPNADHDHQDFGDRLDSLSETRRRICDCSAPYLGAS